MIIVPNQYLDTTFTKRCVEIKFDTTNKKIGCLVLVVFSHLIGRSLSYDQPAFLLVGRRWLSTLAPYRWTNQLLFEACFWYPKILAWLFSTFEGKISHKWNSITRDICGNLSLSMALWIIQTTSFWVLKKLRASGIFYSSFLFSKILLILPLYSRVVLYSQSFIFISTSNEGKA